ncbi:MAG TPA: peptidoglycan-binding domain-containing protein [Acidimicrobiales bacterium]|nr:peptidoglycan-binding domain-containing protein [Acidimicrobiales bacterium]
MASKAGGIAVLVLFGLAAIGSTDGGCGDGNGGDGDFDLDADSASTCDGVVVVETASGNAQVPGDTSLIGSEDSASCVMSEGGGDDEAVVVLQTALARCNGQSVGVDGNYGAQTTQAVMNVQQQHGVTADGAYGPATLEVMGWPGTGSAGCVSGVSAGSTVIDEAS